MPKPTNVADNVQIVEEITSQKGVAFNGDTGILTNPIVFAPKKIHKTGRGEVFESNSGRFYSRSAFQSIVEMCSGALAYPEHPRFDESKQDYLARNPKDAIGRWGELFEAIGTNKLPVIRAKSFKFFKGKLADFRDIITEAIDRVACSVCALQTTSEFYPELGVKVITGINRNSTWPPTIDFVEAGGAGSILEEASSKPQEKTMATEATVDVAAIEKSISDKFETKFAACKGALDKALESAAAATRRALVSTKLADAKLDRAKIGESLLAMVESATTTKEQAVKLIDERVKTILESTTAVTGMGAQGIMETVTSQIKGKSRLTEDLENGRCGASILEMAQACTDGQPWDKTSDGAAKAGAKFIEEVCTPLIQEPGFFDQKKHDSLAKLERKGISFHAIFEMATGKQINSGRREAIIEAAIDSSGYATVNALLLNAKVIDAYNMANQENWVEGLVTYMPSRHAVENIQGYTTPAGLAVRGQGNAYANVTMSPKYASTLEPSDTGAIVAITEEETIYDQPGQVLMRANGIGSRLAYLRMKNMLLNLLDASAGDGAYRPSGSQTALFSTGNANIVSNNALANYVNLDHAVQALLAQTDENGDPILDNDGELVILLPNALRLGTGRNVVRSTTVDDPTSSSTPRANFPNPYVGTTILGNQVMDGISTTDWYVGSKQGFRMQYVLQSIWPFQAVQINPAEILAMSKRLVAGVRVSYKERVAALDYRRVVKCTA